MVSTNHEIIEFESPLSLAAANVPLDLFDSFYGLTVF